MKKFSGLILIVCALTLWQCSGSGSAFDETAGGSCDTLCTDAGFDSGTQEDFGEVIECTCTGTGDGIEQTSCAEYCADFEVSEENSLLSTEVVDNDKCVCDGTAS